MSDHRGNKARHADDSRQPAPIELPVERLLAPVGSFANSQVTTGAVLLVVIVLALFLSNSQYAELYKSLNHMPFAITLGDWHVQMSVHHWVNDGLMVLFFFVLGLEIKRECLAGDLRDLQQSALVLFMAIGGMLVPAGVYLLLNYSSQDGAVAGWGIPMATDTALAIGILCMLGSRVPRTVIVLLSALAIVDDIGAVLVISLVYTSNLDYSALAGAAATLAALWIFNLSGFRRPVAYLLGGVVLWWFMLNSGVHATTAGILAALAVPARPYAGANWFEQRIEWITNRLRREREPGRGVLEDRRQHELIEKAQDIAVKASTPLRRWERSLDKPVSLAVVPLFVFLNAGILLPGSVGELFASPVTQGIALGLVLGKSCGVIGFAWLGLRTGLCRLPRDIRMGHIGGIGLMAGIGFTMSLFISALAFSDREALVDAAKLGIMSGSLIAGLLGTALFLHLSRSGKNR